MLGQHQPPDGCLCIVRMYADSSGVKTLKRTKQGDERGSASMSLAKIDSNMLYTGASDAKVTTYAHL